MHLLSAGALRDAAERILRGETLYSVVCEWQNRGIRPEASGHWTVATLAGILSSPRLAGLRLWQGKKYAVLNRVTVSPDSPGRKGSRDRALRMEALRQRTEFDWRL